jgi:preprotein translocase subunit YajC
MKSGSRGLLIVLLLTVVMLTTLTGCTYGTPTGEDDTTTSFLPVVIFTVVLFGMFYFLAIRPQRKRQKQQREMMTQLAKGDKVITAGGIMGVIEQMDEDTIVLKVESGTSIRFARNSVVGKPDEVLGQMNRR